MRRARPATVCTAIYRSWCSCVVAAPSKLQRPAGDRVKTDARDAALLARLLKLDEIVEVTVPSVEQEAARDLVRAREDVRGDLMRARHRLSKMLLRQGIVYTGGKPWTGVHDVWLRSASGSICRAAAGLRRRLRSVSQQVTDRGTGSTRRSWRWPRTASTPRSPDGCAACAGSRR